jgi:predicted dinucleotide-binding enzyme
VCVSALCAILPSDDAQAKETVKQLIAHLGWESVVDMGRIEEARLLEPLALLWIKIAAKRHARDHYIKVLY